MTEWSSTAVPSWVVENFERYRGHNSTIQQSSTAAGTKFGSCIRTRPSDFLYLFDGPTYPIADGGSYAKHCLIRAIQSVGRTVRGIAADWNIEDRDAYKKVVQVQWRQASSYYSDEGLASLLAQTQAKYIIADSIETLARLMCLWPTDRIVAFLLDDFAHMAHLRGQGTGATIIAEKTLHSLALGGAKLLVRSDSHLALLRQRYPDANLFRAAGMFPEDFGTIQTPAEGPCVVVGNFRYPPNLSALLALSKTWPASLPLRIVGDIAEEEKTRLQFPGAELLGVVGDLPDALDGCSVALDPATTGSGTSTKLLTYAFLGIPVVCTDFATRGLSQRLTSRFRKVSAPDQIAAAVQTVRGNEEFHRDQALAAQVIALNDYNMRTDVTNMLSVCDFG